MKKTFLVLLFLLCFCRLSYSASISIAPFLTSDDVTVTHLENMRTAVQGAINSADGSLIQDATITSAKLDANTNPENRWNEAFSDFIFTGLLPPTSTDLTSTTTAGTAYVYGTRVLKDATSKTYTASKQTFVDLSNNGTYTYSEIAIGGAEPAVASNSIRLARVSTDTTKVLEVRDDRVTSIIPAGTRYKVGSFTRDMTGASTTISYTGVGFKPASLIVFGTTSVGIVGSWGMGTESGSMVMYHENGTTTLTVNNLLIDIQTTTGLQSAVISSFDVDGFTLTWTKTNSPTGTGDLKYIAFR